MNPRSRTLPTTLRQARQSTPACWAAVVVGPWAALAVLPVGTSALLPWLALALCFTLAGWAVLRRFLSADPEAEMSRNMVVFGTLGMLAGLALDVHGPGLVLIASLCGAGAAPSFLQVSYLHWSSLPAMHFGMLFAGLSAAPLRRLTGSGTRPSLRVDFLRHSACSVWMLVGMTVGSMLFERLAVGLVGASVPDLRAVAMLGGMFAGMVWGMVAHTAVSRIGKRLCGIPILPA